MQYQSQIRIGSDVTFPEWKGERHYMLPFTSRKGLSGNLSRYGETVERMLAGTGVDPDQECYLMIDEGIVQPGVSHRRPGMHVDGYWWPGDKKHGPTHRAQCHGGAPPPGTYWREAPTPSHHPVHQPGHGPSPVPGHRSTPGHSPLPGTHALKTGVQELVLLASNHSAARALLGTYERDFESRWDGGDCSSLNVDGMEAVRLQANKAYHLDVFTLHESLTVSELVRRTVVRINVPNCSLS